MHHNTCYPLLKIPHFIYSGGTNGYAPCPFSQRFVNLTALNLGIVFNAEVKIKLTLKSKSELTIMTKYRKVYCI